MHRGAGAFAVVILILSPSFAHAADYTVVYDAATGYIDAVLVGIHADLPVGEEKGLHFETGVENPVDPVRLKVDTATRLLIPNDYISIVWDSTPLVAGSGETRAIEIVKRRASGHVLEGETSSVWIALHAVEEGRVVLEPQGPRSIGTLDVCPRDFIRGRCRAVVRAGDRAGEDMLLVAQPGLEPRWVRIIFENRLP